MRKRKYLYISIFFFLLTIVAVNLVQYISNSQLQEKKVQNVFKKKYKQTRDYIDNIPVTGFKNAAKMAENASRKGITILVFEEEELKFWSNNDVPYSQINFANVKNNSVIKLSNSYYYFTSKSVDEHTVVGIIHIANDYPYENRFLVNGLHPDFSKSGARIFMNENQEGAYPVYNTNDEFVFSVLFEEFGDENTLIIRVISVLFLFVGVIFFFVFLRFILNNGAIKRINLLILLLLAGFILIRWLLITSDILGEKLYFFDPFIYATRIAPTFGDLLMNTLFFLFSTYLIYKYVKIPDNYLDNTFNRNAWVGIINTLLVLVLWYVSDIMRSIITDSSISVVMHNISNVSVATVFAYIIFGLHFFAFFLLALWAQNSLKLVSKYRLIINFSTILMVFFLFRFVTNLNFDFYTVIFAIVLYTQISLIKQKLYDSSIFSSIVILLLAFSVYILLFTAHYSQMKGDLINRSFAENLSSEHDPIAEYVFEEVSEDLGKDKVFVELLTAETYDPNEIHSYLSRNYFKGYLKKYNLRVTVCLPTDSVYIELPDYNWYPCYEYFENYISDLGIKVPGVPFYYIENFAGTISYFGWIKRVDKQYGEISVFVELDSKPKLTTQPLGYPELLLDKKVKKKSYYDGYSYAKYHKGSLISHNGNFDYSLKSDIFVIPSSEEFYKISFSDYTHLVYNQDAENLVVVSEKTGRLLDQIVVFSYVFVFYYLIALFTIFILVSKYRHLSFRDSLRNKIQFSVILILIASLILIAGSTTWFNIRKYNQSQFRILKEKIQSVYVELEHKLSFEDTLTADWSAPKYDNLEQLLIKFSDVFYSDINLYSPEGYLIASSRPEVFHLGLQNKRMEPHAFYKLNNERLAQYIHKEYITNLSYLSAYIPFVNHEGKLLAYLNLPYFTKQKELQEDITTLTVAIINIYVLLILLTIVIAVVISNQITKPLEMLQARFRGLTLGGQYEQINYHRYDEIGKLVNEYNRMVVELEKNIQLLAKSERETAWREMAKQVAHEIKNPLTPMRLSVQYLQRAWDDKKENFESYLLRVTQTLIEQIDNLSTIAGEFSNFAKMPVAKIDNVNVANVLYKAVDLFKGNEKVSVNIEVDNDDVTIKADPEQLNRVFINIIKNGIQSISDDRKGLINIHMKSTGEEVEIIVRDNGKGIPEDIRNKLFMPNFTTKSSGMGLGLAIVRNILEQINGDIGFTTELGVGTEFIITIPIAQDN